MTREQGFPIADVDSSFFDDPKIRRLWRRCQGNEVTMTKAVVTYLATLLESWASGERVHVEDAAPAWLVHDHSVAIALLEVGLLDEDGRLPGKSWEGWYGPAKRRWEARRESGRVGALKRWHSDAIATPEQSYSTALPIRTIHPSIHTEPSTPALPEHSYGNGRNPGNLTDDALLILRARAVLADNLASEDKRKIAQATLDDLGVSA